MEEEASPRSRAPLGRLCRAGAVAITLERFVRALQFGHLFSLVVDP
jgi:hypothetical protein